MNRIYSDPIEKSRLLAEGLKKNREFLASKGYDLSLIEKLEQDCEKLAVEGEAIAREEAALSQHRKQCHVILNRLRSNLLGGKGEIKRLFEQEDWVKYGVHDKR